MSSIHINHLLSDFLEGNLTRAQVEKTKSHLVFCNACRQNLRDFEKNRETLGLLAPAAPPQDLEQKIIAGVRDKIQNSSVADEPAPAAPREPIHWKPLLRGTALIAGVLVVFGIFKMIAERASQPAEPAAPPESTEQTPAVEPQTEAPVVAAAPEAPEPPAPVVQEAPPPPPPPPAKAVSEAQNGPLDLRGSTSGIEEPREVLIKRERDWKNIWKNHVKNEVPPPALPAVDFSENEIIAIFGGNQPSAGYSLEITSVEETTWEGEPARIVHYKTSEPKSDMMAAMMITQPFHIKTTPKRPGPAFFRRNR